MPVNPPCCQCQFRSSGERPFLCGECGKSFLQKAHLKAHVCRAKAERRKYHPCPDCGAEYANLGDLRVHRRHHTGETPFRCGVCDRGFRAMRLLRNHLRRQHTDERPFNCANCHRTFATSDALNVHFRRNDTCRLTATKGAFAAKKDGGGGGGGHDAMEDPTVPDRATGFDALIGGSAVASAADLLVPGGGGVAAGLLAAPAEEGDEPPDEAEVDVEAEPVNVDANLKFVLPPPAEDA